MNFADDFFGIIEQEATNCVEKIRINSSTVWLDVGQGSRGLMAILRQAAVTQPVRNLGD